MRCLRLSGALAYGEAATPMTLLSSRNVRVPSRRPKPSTASMKPADQLRRRNSPSVIVGRPIASWKVTISRTHSSCRRFTSASPILPALRSRAAWIRRSGRRKLPTCSTLKGGLKASTSLVFLAQQLRAVDHRLQLAVGHLARQVFHAAIGGDDHVLRLHVPERLLQPLDHLLRRLDRHVGKVDATD